MSEATPSEGIQFLGDAHLRDVVRRSLRAWRYAGVILIAVFVLLQALFIPQTFTSTVSLAVQQPSGGGSALAALTGTGSPKRYIGILKSRLIAGRVNDAVHLESLYALRGRREAVDLLVNNAIQVRDDMTGLVYVSVTLPGPARLSRDSAYRERVKRTALVAATLYAGALRTYYTVEDNSQDAATLRGAQAQFARARADFDRALSRLASFMGKDLDTVDPRALPGVEAPVIAGTGPSGAGAPADVMALYASIAQAEVALRSTEAFAQTARKLTNAQLTDPRRIPSEDPLLAEARRSVATAERTLANYEVQLGPRNPTVVAARQRVEIARQELKRQVDGIRLRRTTEEVRSSAQAAELQAKRTQLRAQLSQAEDLLRTRRRLSTKYETLRNECVWRMEALKATAAAAAQIYTTTSALSTRIVIVDRPEPAESGSPRLMTMCFMAVLWAILTWALWIAFFYVRTRPAEQGSETPAASQRQEPGA